MLIIAIFFLCCITASASTLKHFTSNGTKRSYWIRLPNNHDENKAYPVVIVFHGSSKLGGDLDGFALEADARFTLPVMTTKYSEQRIFVYPNGLGGTWAGPSYAKATIPQDLKFVEDLLANVREDHKVDDSRIFATGFSNGGGFIGILACSPVGSQFAAFTAVSGAFYLNAGGIDVGNCAQGRSLVPMLEIHGGSDKTVKYEGGQGEGGTEPSIPSWLSLWQQRNGCATPPATEDSDNGNVHHTSWSCGGKAGALQHWKVDKGDHFWPSKTPTLSMVVAKAGPQPIEANDIIIGFFDGFSLGC